MTGLRSMTGLLFFISTVLVISTINGNHLLNSNTNKVVVVGSINADIIVPIDKLPDLGETIVALSTDDCGRTIAGGKGANQAVASRRLGASTSFVCKFGSDANAKMLKDTMTQNNVEISHCKDSEKPSGIGLVLLQSDGTGSAIVLGGSNADWSGDFDATTILQSGNIACILLQMEIPQFINDRIAEAAEAAGIPVFQDCGGTDSELTSSHLKKCTYVSPNLTELKRMTKLPVSNEDEIIAAAKFLQSKGARNVLVTMGSDGALLLQEGGKIIKQPVIPIEPVLDETGAGDNYRAAFVVSHFVDKKTVEESLEYAAVAGALAVSKMGAIPACSTRQECDEYLKKYKGITAIRGGWIADRSKAHVDEDEHKQHSASAFPYKFASRLNSMKDRADLWQGEKGVLGWIARQGKIKGLDLIDFNYPQHITSPTVTGEARREIMNALHGAGLKCGAICLRFPKAMQLGAFTNPNDELRKRAVDMTKEACEWAIALDASEVVVWSAFDGYDYSLQVDYNEIWDRVVVAFQEVCDSYPGVKVSLEYKPTDENTRFFAVPSAGAALLLVNEVNRDNFGLTLDFGHCLMAGENPAQSVAMVSRHAGGVAAGKEANTPAPVNRLFGVQLGDGYGRLGAEDGLAFGSVHPLSALEFVLWLIRTGYSGHIYFDTFPRNEDPVRECEYNIRQFKKYYWVAQQLLEGKYKSVFEECLKNHDAMGILELLEKYEC